jgi:geranylgeranyl pyrophosphate synthase
LSSLQSSSPPWLARYVDVIDSRVAGLFPEGTSSLELAAKGALEGGKRVRAVLALLWCEAVSGAYEAAIPVAVAYELAHAAALVQDDILDQSEFRRGEKSLVGEHGLRPAILASNLLLAQVPREIAVYGDLESGGKILRSLFELLGESFGATVLGEFVDLEMAGKESVGQEDYEYMIRMKTGALVAASSASGVIVGGGLGRDAAVRTAYQFGEWLGMSYQVHDDILDIMGEEAVLGKPVFADIGGGKKNIVLIHAAERSSPDDRRFLRSLLGRRGGYDDSEIARARWLLAEHGSLQYAAGVAASYAQRARDLLEDADVGLTGTKLLELSDYLSSRKY